MLSLSVETTHNSKHLREEILNNLVKIYVGGDLQFDVGHCSQIHHADGVQVIYSRKVLSD